MNNLNKWKISGIITITALGFLMHYVFSWSGNSKLAGLFVPVNESVWEHLKLGYWPVVIFSLLEYRQLKQRVNNYFLAKTIGVLAMELLIVIVFYSYTLFTGKNIVLIDILSYVLGVVVCQDLTHKIFRRKPFSNGTKMLSVTIFISIGILFGVLTYYPPHLNIFLDKNNNTYGINREK